MNYMNVLQEKFKKKLLHKFNECKALYPMF